MKPSIAHYIPIAQMIAKTFGDECEVVLHDLEMPQKSVVYTVNNHVTGRNVGQSFDQLVPQVMLSRKLENDMVANYYFRTANGKLIKSSTALIRDDSGKVVGAMCINLDTSRLTEQIKWCQSLLPGIEDPAPTSTPLHDEEFHVSDLVTDLIERIIGNQDITRLRRDEKLELVRFMEQRGIFLMKGAIDQVSNHMGISPVTVYSYIDEVRNMK